MIETGTIVAVFDYDLGSYLTADVAAGATTLPVSDIGAFSSTGGLLAIKMPGFLEESVPYTGVDEATSSITGVTALVNAYTADDTTVSVFPYVTNRYADVRIDGERDTVRARVPLSLRDRIAEMILSDATGEGMRVNVELQNEYVVQDIIGSNPNSLADEMTVQDLTVEGTLQLVDGVTHSMTPGSELVLGGQQAAPIVKPIVSTDWEVVDDFVDPILSFSSFYDYLIADSRRGMMLDGTNLYYVGNGMGELWIRRYTIGSGVAGTLVEQNTSYRRGSLVKVGTDFYVMAQRISSGDWYVRRYDSAWNFVSEFLWPFGSSSATWPTIFNAGANLALVGTSAGGGGTPADRAVIHEYTTAGVLVTSFVGSTNPVTEAIKGGVYSTGGDDFDYNDGVPRVLIVQSSSGRVQHYNRTTEAYEGFHNSPAAASDYVNGYFWNATDGHFYMLVGGNGLKNGSTYSTLYKMSNYIPPIGATTTTFVGTTWYDDAGTTHETTLGPTTQINVTRRKRLIVQIPETLPSTGTEPPTTSRVYTARATTEPAASAFHLAGMVPVGSTQVIFDGLSEVSAAPPSVNNFPGGGAAIIKSTEDGTGVTSQQNTGLGWDIRGDGNANGFSDLQVFTADGTWQKPMAGGITTVEVTCIGGGGAGGSGARNSAGNAAAGGGGGGGASMSISRWPISAFSDTETVVVGTGGIGGASKSTNTVGNGGTSGTDSTMTVAGVVKIRAKGGDGGQGGGQSAGPWAGGQGNPGLSTFQEFPGAGGGGGATGAGNAADNLPRIVSNWMRNGASAGGGAGGVTAAGAVGSGSTGGDNGDLVGGAAGSGGVNATAGGSKGAGLPFPGAGGGGGAGRGGTGTASSGGNGGLYGAGGGGGGGGQTVDSGAGGNGAQGIVVVRCY